MPACGHIELGAVLIDGADDPVTLAHGDPLRVDRVVGDDGLAEHDVGAASGRQQQRSCGSRSEPVLHSRPSRRPDTHRSPPSKPRASLAIVFPARDHVNGTWVPVVGTVFKAR